MAEATNLSLTLAGAASAVVFLYLGAGLVFAAWFYLRGGLTRVDPLSLHSTRGFRWVIAPGAVALWPWLLALWLRAGREEAL